MAEQTTPKTEQDGYRFLVLFLILIVAIGGLVLGGVFVWGPKLHELQRAGDLIELIALFLPELPYLFILWFVFRKSYDLAFALASGLAVVPILIVPMLAQVWMLFGGSARSLAPYVVLFWPAWPMLLIVFAAFIASRYKRRSLLLMICGVLGIGLYLYLAEGMRETLAQAARDVDSHTNEQVVAQTVLMVDKCAYQYISRHSAQGFPPSLQAMKDEGCLSESQLRAEPNFTIQYVSKPSQGRITNYAVFAKPATIFDQNLFDFFSDASGIVYYTRRDYQHPFAYQFGGSYDFGLLVRCIKGTCHSGPFPDSLLQITNSQGRPCAADYAVDYSPSGVTYESYIVTYQTIARGLGGPNGLILTARPRQYGTGGLRSYIANEKYEIHATPENREATENDPLAPNCEFGAIDCADMVLPH